MSTQARLFRIGTFDFRLNHLLVIGVLVLSFSISFLIRSQAAEFGSELNEFDPFFNFRATEFIVENGYSEYFDWHDDKSWYPGGRNISATSQVMLHMTAAVTYQIFGGDLSLYDFTILFPVIFGSLTVIVIFALVRAIGGTTAGLFAAILFSVSMPILMRGTIGWFKSEPLGIFYGVLGLYFFLSGIKSENKKIAISKLIVGGIILGLGLASWGGIQFFVIPIGMFILVLPFVRKDHEFIIWSIPIFVTSFLLTALMFEFVGTEFVFGLGGFSLIVPTGFLVSCIIIQKFSKIENKTRNGLIFLFMIIIIGSSLMVINEEARFLPLPSFRYLNAINPFLTTTIPLVDSIAEHATTTLAQSFFFHSILMIFAGLGIWIILSKKSKTILNVRNDMIAFSLIIGLTGIYVSSAFIRLEVFASISLIILSSLGLSILIKEIFGNKNIYEKFRTGKIIKVSFLAVILILLIIPLMYPNSNWINAAKAPPTILNGGSAYGVSTNDWTEPLEWIKNNTPEDSVVAAWWDYGYWITTMSDRTTLADNFTGNHTRIELIAKTLLSPPDEAWNNLQEMGADYIVVFVAGQRIDQGQDEPVYLLNGGGDESKKQWFMRIAGVPLQKYVHPDGSSGTDYFWNDTLLGKLFPFSTLAYIDPRDTETQSQTWKPGLSPVYGKDIKYPTNGEGPFRLVHASPSFVNEGRVLLGVFIYEINDNYIT
ncbi:MAG: glycosyltransferase family 39 protein [Thaumarchaeota archaeon]|nr:glycosyltransferase family 39 protein [Nitrososphaerota archaeon]